MGVLFSDMFWNQTSWVVNVYIAVLCRPVVCVQILSWSTPVVKNSTFHEPHREFRAPLLWVCSCSLGYHLMVSLGWLFPWNQMICLASVSACSKHTCTCAQMLNPLPWFTMQIYWDIARPLDPVHDINDKNLGVHSGSWSLEYTTPTCLHLTTQETSCLVMSVEALEELIVVDALWTWGSAQHGYPWLSPTIVAG